VTDGHIILLKNYITGSVKRVWVHAPEVTEELSTAVSQKQPWGKRYGCHLPL
jgi:hypothetical protein